MSGSGTIYTEQSMLGHTLGFAPMAFPARVYVGLCSAAMPPSETVQGVEAFGNGYQRMPATFALIATPANIAANVATVEYPMASGGWGTLGFFELWDAPAGGNRLYWGALIDTASQLPITITVGSGDIVRFSAGTLAVQAATGTGGTSSVGAYLPLAGGALSGPLLLAADPTTYLQAATKQYVDAHSGTGGGPGFLPLSGGTMLGTLTLAADPASALQSATKQYVDGKIASSGVTSFNTRTGVVALTSGDVTTALAYTPYDAANPAGYQTAAQIATAVAPAQHNIGRNLIHNPLFNVAQRGVGPWTTNGYTLDRWSLAVSLDTANASQGAMVDAARAAIGDESATSYFGNTFTGNAAAGAYNFVFQPIEGIRRLSGKTVTVSFWAIASAALTVGVNIQQNFGSGGSPSTAIWIGNGHGITLTTGWARYSATFTLPSAAGKTLGTSGNDQTQLAFWFSSGANQASNAGVGVQSGTINIWGVQLEIGSVATPLEKPDPRYDLSNCQRFYQTGSAVLGGPGTAGVSNITSAAFSVPFRASPTIVLGTPSVNINSGTVTMLATAGNYSLTTNPTSTAGMQYSNTFTASADL